jgi:hypothetical protein
MTETRAEQEAPSPPATRKTIAVVCGGAAVGLLVWQVLALTFPHTPLVVRFSIAFLLFTYGPGAAVASTVLARTDLLTRAILSCSIGLAAAAVLAEVLAPLGLITLFPSLAAALAGAATMFWWVKGETPGGDRRTWLAAAAVVVLALVLGYVAYAHRLSVNGDIVLYGEYDSFDATYYASISAELSHRIPPDAPFFSGHPLNFSHYPQLLIALVHRFADVPLLPIYFGYAWPAFLVVAALSMFVLTREIASVGAALVSATLFMIGSDFSYLIAWFTRPPTYLWDYLIWSTNFLSPSAETLYFNPYTAALAVSFAALYGLAAAESRHPLTWTLLVAGLLTTLLLFKPFAYAVILTALTAVVVLPGVPWTVRRRYAMVGAVSLVLSVPYLYRIFTMYAESQARLAIGFFQLPRTMLNKLALGPTLTRWTSDAGLEGIAQQWTIVFAATVLFFVMGQGYRLIALPELWRVLVRGTRPVERLCAWIVVAGVVIPFVIVTVPYHQTLHFYQMALFVLPVFVARSLWRLAPSRRALAIAATLLIAAPTTGHYLWRKWTDDSRPFAVATAAHQEVAARLRGLDHESTVVLHDRPQDPSLISILSERRTVLAWWRYVRGSDARRAEVERFFRSASGDPTRALRALRTYKVTHVIQDVRGDRVHADVTSRLKVMLRSGPLVLYEVPRELRE